MKPCTITDYCYGKNPLNVGVDVTQNGRLHGSHFGFLTIRKLYVVVGFDGGMCSTEGLLLLLSLSDVARHAHQQQRQLYVGYAMSKLTMQHQVSSASRAI